MRFATPFIAVLSSLCSLQLASAANPHAGQLPARRRQAGHERRGIDLAPRFELQKRFSDAAFTYYKTGLGACGAYNSDNDFVSRSWKLSFFDDQWSFVDRCIEPRREHDHKNLRAGELTLTSIRFDSNMIAATIASKRSPLPMAERRLKHRSLIV